MNIHPLLMIFAYILTGIFIASAFIHYDNDTDSFDLFMIVMLFWPVVIVVLLAILIIYIPFILGKWVGHLLHDLVKVI